MNDETKAKFAKLFAEQQAKANAKKLIPSKPTTAPTPAVISQPTPVFNPATTNKTSISQAIDRIKQKNVFSDDDINLKAIPATPAPELSKMQSFTITAHEGEELNLEGKEFTTWETANNAIKLICDQYTGPGYYKTYIFVQWENGRNLSDRIDVQDRKGDFWAYTENIGDYLATHYKSLTETLSFKDAPAAETHAPELSNYTFADLMNTTPATPAPAEVKPQPKPATTGTESKTIGNFTLLKYSDISFALLGPTKPYRETLRYKFGGKFNYYLRCGEGWIFSLKKYHTVKTFIESQQTA